MLDKQERTAVLVAGMHRSGTSALAHVLGLAGCDLPKALMYQNDVEGRRKGYAESWVISPLNKEILSAIDHCGFEEASVTFSAAAAAATTESPFRERALAALRDEYGDSRLFVIKDPRLCLLLKFWIDAVEAFGARPVVICPIRNPLEVARSLKSRNRNGRNDGRSTGFLFLLWLRHVLDAEAASRHVQRAFTRYGDLLEDPSAVLGRAATTLGVCWPRISLPETENEIRAALSPDHRSHELSHNDLRSDPQCSQSVRRVFEILDRWADGDVRPEDMAELDRIKANIDEVTTPLAEGTIHREKTFTASFLNSSSWRITAPLRATKHLLERISG